MIPKAEVINLDTDAYDGLDAQSLLERQVELDQRIIDRVAKDAYQQGQRKIVEWIKKNSQLVIYGADIYQGIPSETWKKFKEAKLKELNDKAD